MGINRSKVALLAAIGLTGLAFCLVVETPAFAGVSCRYVAAGTDGPAGNRLEIKVTRFEEVVALLPGNGANIQVVDDQRMKRLGCRGGRPTMLNIDRVDFSAGRRATGSTLFIDEAPKFGPGATPASVGGKGISFFAKGPSLSFGISGTAGDDLVRMGMDGKAAALDFFPDVFPESEAGDNIDARIFAKFVNLLVKSGDGADQVADSQIDLPNTWFDRPLGVPASIYGEGGPDYLLGGTNMDYLDGGPGADFLTGGSGDDQLFGGGGVDTFIAGPGNDTIDTIDGRPDEEIRCGRGFDLASMDLQDNDLDCESFRFP
ncbi:MAG: hypothetical protein KDB48_10715 [Solirubrobacterales bacterium]|nr:hypothetical protein [Solirubrobacterales bacterium]